ncbi:6401_t:CDS:1, partial [Cetraspora pellucida]
MSYQPGVNFSGPQNECAIELDGLPFSIQIETLPQPNHARVFFLNNNEEIEIPDGIRCEYKMKTNNILNPKMPKTRYFLINHPNNYELFYNDRKICTLFKLNDSYIIRNETKLENNQ